MEWRKIGHIFSPNENYEWMYSHAANPFAEQLTSDVFRIYFTCRNERHQSYIAYLDYDMSVREILNVSDAPVLSPGEPGLFDDSGVAMGFLLNTGREKLLYYLGWNLKVTVPWLNTIGLAKWDNETNAFRKCSKAPVMDRSHEDPFSISYPSVLLENGLYRMWYGSNLRWGSKSEDMNHVIKYAESLDGIKWVRTNQIHIDLVHPNEYALSKPFVIKMDNKYFMWYSYRGDGDISTYRIGYAVSADGFNWSRQDDKAGINVSEAGWDSEMICYPNIFEYKGTKYMLYNGNNYGKTGFGMAELINIV